MLARSRPRDPIGVCFPRGYNWCGPGCSGPGAPINAVDAACAAHDACYRVVGQSCRCDREFLNRLRPLINPYTQQGRDARVIYNYMKIQSFFSCAF